MTLTLLALACAVLWYVLTQRSARSPVLSEKSEAQLRAEIEERQLQVRNLHSARGPEPERYAVKNLSTGRVEQFLGSAPCFELHHGEVTETTRPLPPQPKQGTFYPALVGETLGDRERRPFLERHKPTGELCSGCRVRPAMQGWSTQCAQCEMDP